MSIYGKLVIDVGRPVTAVLKRSGETVVVENLEEKDLTETFQLLETAAKRGDNVGVDEYRNVGDFLETIPLGSAFKVRKLRSEVIDAVITVGPCLASRSIRPCLASLQVFTSEGFSRESIWRDCVEMAIGYARQHPFGFSACVTDVFGHCLERITALRTDGFVISASVPRAGKIVYRDGKSPIHMHSYVMYKDIGEVDNKRPCRSEFIKFSTEIISILNRAGHDHDAGYMPESTPPSLIPRLPFECSLSPASLTVIVRQVSALPEDLDRYYDFFRSTAEEGVGFSVEEFPTKEIFWEIYGSSWKVVLEDKSSGKLVAIINWCGSWYSRCRESCEIFDTGMIIAKEFRNSGLGTPIFQISKMIAKDLGCRIIYSDIPAHHIASIALFVKNGNSFSGSLPRAIYSPTYGWSDVLLLTMNLDAVSKI